MADEKAANVAASSPSSSASAPKQRRVSLPHTTESILPMSSFSAVATWAFRDEMGLASPFTLQPSTMASSSVVKTDSSPPPTPQEPSSSATPSVSATPTRGTRKRASTTSTKKDKVVKQNASLDALDIHQVNGGLTSSTSVAPPAISASAQASATAPAASSSSAPASSATTNPPPLQKPRKPRKRWTMEETQALVDGCNKWGVGNWKAILNDPQFDFQSRSPVDLKDRFRTYFPDAYRHHYPNAKTHLSSRVRSFLPDGTSIFEKTRSKKRRPFSAEEDEALRLGYEKHGTTWATIVKDPVFASQERRSTDLRDRFRNAFPELYKAAGYKPRPRANASTSTSSTNNSATTPTTATKPTEVKKGRRARADTVSGSNPATSTPSSSATRAQAAATRRKRASLSITTHERASNNEPTALDFYRNRSASGRSASASRLPTSSSSASVTTTTPTTTTSNLFVESPSQTDSEDDDSDSEPDEDGNKLSFTSRLSRLGSASPTKFGSDSLDRGVAPGTFAVPELPATLRRSGRRTTATRRKLEMDVDADGDISFDEPMSALDKHSSDGHHQAQQSDFEDFEFDLDLDSSRTTATSTTSQVPTALTSPEMSQSIQELLNTAAAAANGVGATSFSVASDDWASSLGSSHLVNGVNSSSSWLSTPGSPSTSDFHFHSPLQPPASSSRIGKSAWVPQDWLSNNPRLDAEMGLLDGSGALTAWPQSSTSSLYEHHGIFDRYDLYSVVEAAHDFASEAAADDRHHHHHHHHHYQGQEENIFREFTHHRYAGDLIPGSGVAVHPPSLHAAPHIGSSQHWPLGGLRDFGFGSLGAGEDSSALGLGVEVGGLGDDYPSSVVSPSSRSRFGSGSNVSSNGAVTPAAVGALASSVTSLEDIDELEIALHTTPLTASETNGVQREHLDMDGMIVEDGAGSTNGGVTSMENNLADQDVTMNTENARDMPNGTVVVADMAGGADTTSTTGANGMETEALGAVTPTSLKAPVALPVISALALDLPQSMPYRTFDGHRTPGKRPHSRSVNHPPPSMMTPTCRSASSSSQDSPPTVPLSHPSRSISQPPSEHRQTLQRSLSFLDSFIMNNTMTSGFGSNSFLMNDDPLAYNEPLSISSLDLQYGGSAGPNIFTPLTMFTDQATLPTSKTVSSRPFGMLQRASLSSATILARSDGEDGNNSNGGVSNAPPDALDLSALIHTSPPPSMSPHPPSPVTTTVKTHHRHQSLAAPLTASPRDTSMREPLDEKKKRVSWDGGATFAHHFGSSSGNSLANGSQTHHDDLDITFFPEFSRV
ncbi:hypothetical protein FRC03_000675 [Tulasnella sp. 419]|nr:hypothetical protein FRC03_000675 [Tulasnella sp. 419]